MSWTDERIDRLKALWLQGMTASQIADELGGVSRNAVIGKAHRLGLQSRPSPVKPNEPAPAPTPKAKKVASEPVEAPPFDIEETLAPAVLPAAHEPSPAPVAPATAPAAPQPRVVSVGPRGGLFTGKESGGEKNSFLADRSSVERRRAAT